MAFLGQNAVCFSLYFNDVIDVIDNFCHIDYIFSRKFNVVIDVIDVIALFSLYVCVTNRAWLKSVHMKKAITAITSITPSADWRMHMAQRTRLPSVKWRTLPDGTIVVYKMASGIYKQPLDEKLRHLFDAEFAALLYAQENDK